MTTFPLNLLKHKAQVSKVSGQDTISPCFSNSLKTYFEVLGLKVNFRKLRIADKTIGLILFLTESAAKLLIRVFGKNQTITES